MNDMLRQYLETALWSSTYFAGEDDPGRPFDDAFDIDDFAPEAIEQAREDCEAFAERMAEHIATCHIDDEQLGHDFWLTRNGHGVGFWDRGHPEPASSELTKESKAYGSCDVYVGDDGKLYLS